MEEQNRRALRVVGVGNASLKGGAPASRAAGARHTWYVDVLMQR